MKAWYCVPLYKKTCNSMMHDIIEHGSPSIPFWPGSFSARGRLLVRMLLTSLLASHLGIVKPRTNMKDDV